MKFNSRLGDWLFKGLFFAIYSVFLLALYATFVQGIAMGILEWQLCFALVIFTFPLLCTKY